MAWFRQPDPILIPWDSDRPIPICSRRITRGLETILCDQPTNLFISSMGSRAPVCQAHLAEIEAVRPRVQIWFFRWPIQPASRPANSREIAADAARAPVRRFPVDVCDFEPRSPEEIYWRGENPLVETIIHRHYGGRDPRRPQP